MATYLENFGNELEITNHDNATIAATRGSAIAEEPRETLRQLKYYGRV